MFKRLLIVCCVGLFFGATNPSVAQFVKPGIDGPIPLGKLDEMESALGLANAAQKADLLARLGVDPAIAKMIAVGLLPGEKIELQSMRVLQSTRVKDQTNYAIAFLPSGTGTCSFLYLLQGSDENPAKSPWHAIDQQSADSWDGPASFELMSLRLSNSDDIVLHHVNKGHGSNYVADLMQVFSILNGKLVQTLSTNDFLSQATVGADEMLEQRSTFVRFPDLSLEETRTSTLNGELNKVERRYWRWSEQARKFIPTPFVSVTAPHI